MTYTTRDIIHGRYRLAAVMAQSDSSRLYQARQIHTKRLVTVWTLTKAALEDKAATGKFLHEAELLTQARHRNVVEVLDAVSSMREAPIVVTELLAGRALDSTLAARGQLAIDEAVAVIADIADALGHVHELGMVHGGLHPGNIVLFPRPKGAVVDGPAAKLMGFGQGPCALSAMDGPLATMGYASFDRLSGKPATAAADVHSLASISYECVAGELPQQDDEGYVPRLHELRPETPRPLSDTIAQALTGGPDGFADARAFARALQLATATAPPTASLPPAARRAATRASYCTLVRLVRPNAPALDGRSEDISTGGMLVIGHETLDAEEPVQVRFALPSSGEIVSLHAVARWVRAARDGKGAIGLQFDELPDDARTDIASYVDFFGASAN